jgi:undecaprenyl-diphosphatase
MAPTDLDVRALLAVYGGAHGPWGPAMVAFTVLGSGWSVLALVPMIRHSLTRRFASVLAIAIAIQAVLVWSLKRAVGRVRPWIALGLPQPIGAPHDPSFPSGHATASFCVAAFVAIALPYVLPGSPRLCRLVAVLSMVIAALVAFSRVYLGAHFPSDVAAGALLGSFIGAVAAAFYAAPARRLPPIG